MDTPIVKVADFGMAKIKSAGTQDMTANAGTYVSIDLLYVKISISIGWPRNV